MATPLLRADILSLSGKDAQAFAHAQFTTDVRSLDLRSWQWSAWLDPQGRTRALFVLLHTEPGHLLAWLPLGGAKAMREALSRFVMRSALQLDTPQDWTLHQLEDTDGVGAIADHGIRPHGDGFAFAQPGPGARHAWIAPVGDPAGDQAALVRWRQADVAERLPLLAPALAGEFVPQALDLERIDAIRFDKGCYPGQEIAARLHFRGGNKRHLQRVQVAANDIEPATSVLRSDGSQVGRILYAVPDGSGHASDAIAVLGDTEDSGWTTVAGQPVRTWR